MDRQTDSWADCETDRWCYRTDRPTDRGTTVTCDFIGRCLTDVEHPIDDLQLFPSMLKKKKHAI